MNLFSQTAVTIAWIAKINSVFFKIRPFTTFLLVLSSSTLRFVQILTTFLPLKVLLLAASDGIPAYFRFFIEPHQKSQWIIILAFGAVGFYIFSLLLERWIRWLSETGSLQVLQGANEIAVSSRSQSDASSYYAKFGGVLADTLVVIVAMALLSFINLNLLYTLLAAFTLQYVIAYAAFKLSSPYETKGLKHVLIYNLSGYLATCSTINFLLSFFVLLYPFVSGQGGNLLFSILAILLLRQTLSALSSVVGTGVGLWKKKFQIDPLVFRHKQLVKPEHKSKKTMRVLFDKPVRERIAVEQLGVHLQLGENQSVEVSSTWQDPTVNKVSSFMISVKNKEAGEGIAEAYYQHQVIPKGMLTLFEHEDFLFENISRQELKAPEVRAIFTEGDFICRIYDYGSATALSPSMWKNMSLDIVSDYWCIAPPKKLVSSYLTSHPTLPGRLTQNFIERVSLAVDSAEERRVFKSFLRNRGKVVKALSQLPLFIYNPDLSRANVVDSDEGYLVMSWGRWKLEPIGIGMPSNATPARLEKCSDSLIERRGLKEQNREKLILSLRMVDSCHKLEAAIVKEHYKKAFTYMRDILRNPLVGSESPKELTH